jgi:phospho-N-acetylmuramoyl-pentapeptide-transferase
MLYWITQCLQDHYHALRVFQYITFRSILAALTALFFGLYYGPKTINWLRQMQIGQMVRDDGPKSHFSKAGTPTMGGILILFSITASTLLWADLQQTNIWILLGVTWGFGLLGWYDDYKKLVLKNSKGVSAKGKLLVQSSIAIVAVLYLYFTASVPIQTQLVVPFFKNCLISLAWMFPILAFLVIVGSSNAVNLTDGLDGLAILPIVMVSGALGIFAYVTSNAIYAQYLAIPYVPNTQEITIFCASIVGAGLGFLWYNAFPAQIFMGDVGSLSLGAAIGCIAVLIRQELILLLMGGLFVMETLSVILQVGYFKYTGGKRLFKMAPLHHHFELQGWSEPKVIVRFWIITVVLVLMGLATMKLR